MMYELSFNTSATSKNLIYLYKISKDIADEFLFIWKSEFENLNFNLNSFVHKDFELQNLMHLPQRKGHLRCGILDFQNAFIGFSGWDVFSLLEYPRIYFEDKYNDMVFT